MTKKKYLFSRHETEIKSIRTPQTKSTRNVHNLELLFHVIWNSTHQWFRFYLMTFQFCWMSHFTLSKIAFCFFSKEEILFVTSILCCFFFSELIFYWFFEFFIWRAQVWIFMEKLFSCRNFLKRKSWSDEVIFIFEEITKVCLLWNSFMSFVTDRETERLKCWVAV